MFEKVLIANRGAIAARVLRSLRDMGIRSVCVYSEADRDLPYLAEADETYCIGEAAPAASYLNQSLLLETMRQCGADAVHPGYGFLSENADFAAKVHAAGATFIGPSPRWIEAMGHKTRARKLMAEQGLGMGLSSGVLPNDPEAIVAAAQAVGYPVLVKPAAGGGGIGMLPAHDRDSLLSAVERARSLSERSFGSAELYLERLIEQPRHIEFQLLADRYGKVRHLFERDCSVQRRHQKVIEESPAPGVSRESIQRAADEYVKVLSTLGYDIIGTAESLYDGAGFHFLEMNTRLQVEHAVTEAITGVDLVASQIRLAAGETIDAVLPAQLESKGHALEVRVYAEDPVRFFPSPGTMKVLRFPETSDLRIETGYREGSQVTPYYDPLIAKLIVHGRDRTHALELMRDVLRETRVEGIKTNIPFIQAMLSYGDFVDGNIHTGLAAAVAPLVKASLNKS